MRKVIASINQSIDGYCDHTVGIADEEIHDHFANMLHLAGILLYGRTTYQMMESFWPTLVANPSGERHMDDFAKAIDRVPKLLFSRTLKKVEWKTTTLATKSLAEEIRALRQQPGKDIYVGSPSLISACFNENLADEYQLVVHPVIAGKGLPLFKNVSNQSILKLTNTKRFGSGAILLTYEIQK